MFYFIQMSIHVSYFQICGIQTSFQSGPEQFRKLKQITSFEPYSGTNSRFEN
jgi:hypothetical protein